MAADEKVFERAKAGDREALGSLLAAEADACYAVALRLAGGRERAEEIVQEAATRSVRSFEGCRSAGSFRPWLLRLVVCAAADAVAARQRRSRVERRYAMERAERATGRRDGRAELREHLERALASLEERYRMPLVLCHEQGLTQREAAAVLGVPAGTVASNVARGIEKLRERLRRDGLTAAVAFVIAEAPRLAAPPGLAARLRAAPAAKAALAAGVGAAKGGISMKGVAGIVLAAAIAGGVAAVGSGLGPLASEEPRKFGTPVTHPDARWKREGAWAGLGFMGYLDGPRRQVRAYAGPGRGVWYESGGDYVWRAYNPANECYYTVGGRARGYLDGPLSRARLGGIGYMRMSSQAASPDGRYRYFTEPDTHGVLRVIDFRTQTVRTILKKGVGKMTADSQGRLWTVGRGTDITIYNPDGSVAEQKKIRWEGAGHTGQLTMSWCNILLDERNNRLYGANRATGDWTIWYWDLATGRFVGVLPIPKEGEPKRSVNETGPFKGTAQRCPGGIAWGPDDPGHRYLYQGGGDNTTFYRLDLEKQEFVHFGPVDRNKRPYVDMAFNHGKWLPFGSVSKWCGCPGWDEEGNIYLGVSLSSTLLRFRRVK